MQIKGTESSLIVEEKRTVKWFLALFYIITIGYDVFYYYVIPKYFNHKGVGFLSDFGYLTYVLLLALVPITWYLVKHGKQNNVKYIYFISYTIFIIISDLYTFLGSNLVYESGNAVEVFLILFSPIFVNRTYFWLVCSGTLLKYIIIGVVLNTSQVLYPMILFLVLAVIAYIFLTRFTSYVRAIEDSFDKQLQGIVKGVIATLELKDPYTRGHSERVASYALAMAKEYGKFTKEELKEYNYACLLHDVGKINIPDQILMKPAKLTDEEFDVIKTHPAVGAEVVEGVEGLNNGILVIKYHHERWDGKGYPEQLIGEEIPLLARFTSIADAFDAMTSSRSYRKAMPLDVAYERVIEGMGTQFDPNLEELFKSTYPKWKEFHQKYPWNDIT